MLSNQCQWNRQPHHPFWLHRKSQPCCRKFCSPTGLLQARSFLGEIRGVHREANLSDSQCPESSVQTRLTQLCENAGSSYRVQMRGTGHEFASSQQTVSAKPLSWSSKGLLVKDLFCCRFTWRAFISDSSPATVNTGGGEDHGTL